MEERSEWVPGTFRGQWDFSLPLSFCLSLSQPPPRTCSLGSVPQGLRLVGEVLVLETGPPLRIEE